MRVNRKPSFAEIQTPEALEVKSKDLGQRVSSQLRGAWPVVRAPGSDSPAPHMVPQALPGEMSECRVRNKPEVLLDVPQNNKSKEKISKL